MANPQVNFRLSPYQIARGLRVLRRLEPTYQFTSIHQIIKDCYLDYIAKMSIGTDDQILFQDMEEIEAKISSKVKPITIDDLSQQLSPANFTPPKQSEALEKLVSSIKHESCKTDKSCKEGESRKEDTSSKISTVSDFSPPPSWLDEEDSTPNN